MSLLKNGIWNRFKLACHVQRAVAIHCLYTQVSDTFLFTQHISIFFYQEVSAYVVGDRLFEQMYKFGSTIIKHVEKEAHTHIVQYFCEVNS